MVGPRGNFMAKIIPHHFKNISEDQTPEEQATLELISSERQTYHHHFQNASDQINLEEQHSYPRKRSKYTTQTTAEICQDPAQMNLVEEEGPTSEEQCQMKSLHITTAPTNLNYTWERGWGVGIQIA